jgi:chromate transporter
VFLVASKLGISSFGGPIAHLGYFRREYVERRRWLDEATYSEIVGICQFLPGPTSSEVGLAIGLLRAGPQGAFAAWLGFTLPSVIAMVAFAVILDRVPPEARWVFAALQLLALAVVALAVWRMARALAWDAPRGAMAVAAAAVVLAASTSVIQVAVIVAAAVIGWLFLPAPPVATSAPVTIAIGRSTAIACLLLYVALLAGLPLARAAFADTPVALADPFYRAGALVFGGGHVILPLLQPDIVPQFLAAERFYAGYGAVQLMPGPINTFAAYVGTASLGITGAVVAVVAVFLPAFLLVFAALPSWGALRARPWARSALRGVNAAVVGLLLAALITLARTAIASVSL